MSLRKLIVQLETALAPTRKLSKGDQDAGPARKSAAPAHHTPALANKHNASTTAPTRKVDRSTLPKSGKRPLKPGEKMVFGRIVKTK